MQDMVPGYNKDYFKKVLTIMNAIDYNQIKTKVNKQVVEDIRI